MRAFALRESIAFRGPPSGGALVRVPLMGVLGGAGLWLGLAGAVLPEAAATEVAERTARTSASKTTATTTSPRSTSSATPSPATRVASAAPGEAVPVTVPMPRPRPAVVVAVPAARPAAPAPSPTSAPAQPAVAQPAAVQPATAQAGPQLASLTPPAVPLPRVRPAGDTGDPRCGGGKLVRSAYYWQGTKTASGQRFDPDGFTAAHRTLPFGTRLTVKNPRTGRAVEVVVNDRGPYTAGLHIDISRGAARAIGLQGTGTVCLM